MWSKRCYEGSSRKNRVAHPVSSRYFALGDQFGDPEMTVQSIATLHGVAIPSATSTETKPGIEIERSVTQEPPYKVILHNDDYTPMEHVVAVLQKVIPRMSVKRAVDIMMEAHTKGKAVATKCHKELAELYQDGLNNEGLISTIEPD
jgi:ATP-dependent Clp protease adaptor protein ClpS